MARAGWSKLIPTESWPQGATAFRIDAYSEFMPPPRVGWRPYGPVRVNPNLFSPDDPFGWKVHEFDEALELQPGLHQIAKDLMIRLKRLQDGNPDTGLPRHISQNNPYYPPELASADLQNDRCVLLLPLALSRTQDDKGRVRWTLFGNSEQGPGKAFWRSFFTAPGVEAPPEFGIGFFCRLLHAVYGEKAADADGLHRAGLRIVPEDQPDFPFWSEGELPSWATQFLVRDDEPSDVVKYVVTFRQFGRLPAPVRERYLSGRLALLPFPGSLVFWGVERARLVYQQLPLALQIPLLANVDRHESPIGIRVPQAGVLHQPTAEQPTYTSAAGHLRNTYKRTHRWEKILRDQDQVELVGKEASLVNVLFSIIPDDLGLYGKPMARNVQIWTRRPEVLLDGPHASPADIKRAMRTIQAGGVFGYRFFFPAMRVGKHEVYWHRPLVAYQAHLANEIWNESVPGWNKRQKRGGLQRSRRSPHGAAIPEVAPFLQLAGHVRVPSDPRRTIYNTDGQIFSDAGVPCVLFMENYDINRTGYHDTHDTMENIDLDYGAAVCAITIEAVARAAHSKDSPL